MSACVRASKCARVSVCMREWMRVNVRVDENVGVCNARVNVRKYVCRSIMFECCITFYGVTIHFGFIHYPDTLTNISK